ncbi:hypothetical protein MLIT_48370 [Mycolicibacterium litorale]|uniref:DUF6779 domain-containing protein n=2 Tax=Mycolicibacterium litorale TaxID=758802 RepID=A0AAD1MVT8_9MYCO|nr:hypothetical protein BCL50_2932 [Mycolicibacterium litorale]BBY19245.1 hypothetical protein MLIT_48370 [Mycolicibacterium litorale]
MLLTVLLVLAILASSALVFTNRVELLKLAVILALWAAVAAAFVSVIYRRQSDHDQAKARDLKLVYDLQLDREISARREYELTVESQLRRELASELQAQAADEVAALRAELAALRTNLEILFDTDLAHRPAIEHDRTTVRAYSDWAPDNETTGRVSSSRLDAMLRADDIDQSESRTEESPIIDVPAEPQPPEPDWVPPPGFGGAHRRPSEPEPQTADRGGRRRRVEEPAAPMQAAPPPPPPRPEPAPAPEPEPEPEPDTDPGIASQPQPWQRPAPEPEPEPEPAPVGGWQPAPAEGQWIPAGAPGSHWVAPQVEEGAPQEYVGRRRAQEPAPEPAPEPLPEPGTLAESETVAEPEPAVASTPEPRRGKHSADAGEPAPAAETPALGPVFGPREETPEEAHARRRRSIEDTGGQSVAELLARLQANPTAGGGRRRREP